MEDNLIIKGIEFKSRLWVGTGKYKDFEETKLAIEASGADVVTVAVRRTNIFDNKSENHLDYIDPKKYKILPNTAGCFDANSNLARLRLRIRCFSDLENFGQARFGNPDLTHGSSNFRFRGWIDVPGGKKFKFKFKLKFKFELMSKFDLRAEKSLIE